MSYAIDLAYKGRFTTTPNPNVGCLIVNNKNIVGQGWHYRVGEPHAEIYALNMAGHFSKNATVYVTLEPCSHIGNTKPCCDALIQSGISRIVIAMQDPNPKVCGQGIKRLKEAGIDVTCGYMQKEAEKINPGFLKRMRTGLPWIQLKLASSLDGKIALYNGKSKWITSSASRCDVQRLRAESSAILSTSATVLKDNPNLIVRWEELHNDIQCIYPLKDLRQPIRVIIDSKNKITPKYHVANYLSRTILVRLKIDKKNHWPDNVEQIILSSKKNKINIFNLLKTLGKRKINKLLIESGSKLSGFFLEHNLIDELIIYLSGKVLGHEAKSLFHLKKIKNMMYVPNFNFQEMYKIGKDIRLILIQNKK